MARPRKVRNGFRRPHVNARTADIRSVADVIELAGGVDAVAKRFGISPQAVCNWRIRGNLPTHSYAALSKFLLARGFDAPRSLWPFIRQTDLVE